MDKIIILAVGGAVAIGTVLYYLLTKEKPMGQRSGPGKGSSPQHPRPRSPPISYSDVKPKPCRKRPVPIAQEDNISKAYKSDEESGENSISLSPIPVETQNVARSFQEIADNIYPDNESEENSEPLSPIPVETQNIVGSSADITVNRYLVPAECEACGEPADATLYPCKHRVFCRDHADHYFEFAKDMNYAPKCPDCRELLEYYTV